MRIFVGFIALFVSVIISNLLTIKFTLKRKFYNDFYEFNKRYKSELAFKRTTLIKLIKEINTGSNIYLLLTNHFNKSCETIEFTKQLSDGEMQFINSYLNSIGRGDVASQTEFINQSNEIIYKSLNYSIEEEKKYKTLYIKIGFLAGLIIFVLII